MMRFLMASTWDDSRRVLNAHPELINVGAELIDVMLTDPAGALRGLTRSEAETALNEHRAVLMRCQQVGVARAFAETSR
ncbi:MAG TPA: hypothetical protein VKS82_24325 [Streptosporangiaceae bacterium]|nr:hypothetical protein [Streptosporangiaceae bacterium]